MPHSRVRASATLFHRRQRDGIDYYRSSPTDIWRALNIQNLNFTGVEATVRVTPSPAQTVDVSYSALRGRQDTAPLGYTKYSFNYPTHSATVSWQGSLRDTIVVRTRIGALARVARDPYALWDISAAGGRGRLRPFIQLANITSTRYEEIQGVIMPGRSILGGVELVLHR